MNRKRGIVRFWVEARCPMCGQHFHEWDSVPQRKDRRGKLLRHRIECDACLAVRVGPQNYEAYKRAFNRMRGSDGKDS